MDILKKIVAEKKNYFKIAMVIALLVTMYALGSSAGLITVSMTDENRYIVVIDAGHGGNDPGKIVGDVYEKDINLSITLKLKKILEENGIEVVLTRSEDVGLYAETDSNKKVADMKNRCNIINNCGADILVSIHQNSYSSQNVKGAQVFFYEHSTEGEKLAGIIQNSIKSSIDKSNERMHKANDSYYILLNVSAPAVIVECGFLTNPEERKKLLDDSYQEEMANAIAMGILEYKNSTNTTYNNTSSNTTNFKTNSGY